MLKNLFEKIENLFAAKMPEEQTGSDPDFDPQVHAARVLKWQANNARKTHRITYQETFVWENWELISQSQMKQ